MRVIRAPAGVRVLSAVERAAVDRADAIVAHARERAEALVREARTRGEAEASARAAAILARAELAAREATARDEADVAALALDVVRRLLDRELDSGANVLADVVRSAVERVRRARNIVLRVSPDEAPQAAEMARSWLPAGAQPDVFTVRADPSVARGGAIVETDIGRIDARLETQLDAIARALREG